MDMEMNDMNGSFGCGCNAPRMNCLGEIACSQKKVAECEARLFCEVAGRLGCEIRHARCLRELERLLALTSNFLTASAVKENAIGGVIASLDRDDCGNGPCD